MKNQNTAHDLTDADLLQLSSSGDEEAFLILYRRHQGPVFRFALHMCGSRETAEEVTQEVFLAMLTGARQYISKRGCLEAWLIGVARNQVRKQLRGVRRAPLEDAAIFASAAEGSPHSFVDQLSRDRDLALLRTAILSLPPNYREIVILCDLEGLDYAEASARLNCAVGTVRSRLHRARSILEAKLRRREKCPV